MNGEGMRSERPEIAELWKQGPPDGMDLGEWLLAMVKLSWRGADEPTREITAYPRDTEPPEVICVCDARFQFARAGAGVRAVCPGCGCRYVTVEPHPALMHMNGSRPQ